MAKTKEKMLPRMPEEKIKVQVQVPLEFKLDYDFARYSNGSLRMSFADCDAQVSDAAGKKVGTVGASLGGGIFVTMYDDDPNKGRQWFLSYDQLWHAAVEADRQHREGKR